MNSKFHLYMDESGAFEKAGKKKKKTFPFIFGVLVPEEEHTRLTAELARLAKSFGFSGFIHASDLRKRKNFARFVHMQVEILKQFNQVVSFACTYRQDLFSHLPEQVNEAASANRYLNMAQSVLEHLLFLHPDFFGRDLEFDFHPNSRIAKVNSVSKQKMKEFENLGFTKIKFRNQNKDERFFKVWNDDALRVSLHRLAIEYVPFISGTGKRSWKKVETIVAGNSQNALVHWVDNLAWVYGHDYNDLREPHKLLLQQVDIAIDYGFEERRYRELVHLYLNQDLAAFMPALLKELPGFTRPYYWQKLELLIKMTLANLNISSFKQLESLTLELDNFLNKSLGNWSFALDLLDFMIAAVKNIKVAGNFEKSEKDKLLFALYSNKIRLHNHRGEDGFALMAYDNIIDLDYNYFNVPGLRDWIEMENRVAVTLANLFDFANANKSLEPMLAALNLSLKPLSDLCEATVSDPLIGKLKGTMGQNYAFLAPFEEGYFKKAEALFLDAVNQFELDDDRLRHLVNLLHLYLDWGRMEKAEEYMELINSTPGFKKFIEHPDTETAKYMQFALFAYFKFQFKKQNFPQTLSRYKLASLKKWFGPAVNEHPFEFICAILGRMAMRLGQVKDAADYFNYAISIPTSTNFQEQPTLQLIRGQTLTWWALEEISYNQTAAAEKMGKVINLLEEMSQIEGLESVLETDSNGNAVGGWFAAAWEALRKVDWHDNFEVEAAELFLSRFTFNYH